MDGDNVKVTVMFRGREMVHRGRGRDQLDKVAGLLKPLAKMENPPRMEGRFMSMILIADREAVAEAKRAEEAQALLDAEGADTETETDTDTEEAVAVAGEAAAAEAQPQASSESETTTKSAEGVQPEETRAEE